MRFFTFYIYFSLLLAIADGVSHTRGRSPFSRRLFGSKSSLPSTLIKTQDLFSFFNHLKSQGLENTEALDTIVKEFTHLHIFYYKVTTLSEIQIRNRLSDLLIKNFRKSQKSYFRDCKKFLKIKDKNIKKLCPIEFNTKYFNSDTIVMLMDKNIDFRTVKKSDYNLLNSKIETKDTKYRFEKSFELYGKL